MDRAAGSGTSTSPVLPNRRRRWLLALAALVLLVVANWWLGRTLEPEPAPAPRVENRIDYALTEFSGEFFNQRGELALRVSGPRLEHEANTRRAYITSPEFTVEPAGRNWHGTAAQAVLDRDSELLVLEGDARVSQPHRRGTITLESQRLRYDRAAATLVSPGPALIRQGGDELSGGTLTVWIDDERMELQQDVHAIYRPAGGNAAGAGRRRD